MSIVQRKVFLRQLAKQEAGVRKALTECFTCRVTKDKVKSIHYCIRNRTHRGQKVRWLRLWDSGHVLGNMWTSIGESHCEQEGVTLDNVVSYLEQNGAILHKRLPRGGV